MPHRERREICFWAEISVASAELQDDASSRGWGAVRLRVGSCGIVLAYLPRGCYAIAVELG